MQKKSIVIIFAEETSTSQNLHKAIIMKYIFNITISFAATLLLAFILTVTASAAPKPKTINVKSPNGETEVIVTVAGDIKYDLISKGETLMAGNKVAMHLADRTLGEQAVVSNSNITKVRQTIRPDFKLKFAEIENNYNLLTLTLKGGYKILWRVYDDGLAYRFVTNFSGDIEVLSEDAQFNMTGSETVVGQIAGSIETACEELYATVNSNDLAPEQIWEVPFIATYPGHKVLVSEFDLEDYPALFMKPCGEKSINAYHPRNPEKVAPDSDRHQKILEYSEWIAQTSGTRSFPWRYILITHDDRSLAENSMPMRLAPESRIDISWIRRGQTTWDWLNGTPFGPGIDFVSGKNLETYKYYTDFAQKNGVDYILLDEGWAVNTKNPYDTAPNLQLPKLIEYGRTKGVGVILWLPWLTVENNLDKIFATYEEWGVKGVKIDFMNRLDQWMVNYYERVAKKAAEHHIVVLFHGAFHPGGLEYRYPNVLSYEGVRGLEFTRNCTPDNTVFQPFIRNAVGPMDFTPGMMECRQPEHYGGGRPEVPAIGTKASQLAQIVAFESGIQMLADNPCRYDMYPDCRDFICGVPVEWDDTKVLAGKLGEYYVVAKRSEDVWYIAGINNSTAREVEIDLGFLGNGRKWTMSSFTDGPVADKVAMDYRNNKSEVDGTQSITIHMARNGGFAAQLK